MSRRAEPIRSVKGTRDLLPGETALWQRVEEEARRVFVAYNFREIRTPVLEPTALFARSVGADTDIVTKEMYTFQDRDNESLTLRPEATASVVRAYIEHQDSVFPTGTNADICGRPPSPPGSNLRLVRGRVFKAVLAPRVLPDALALDLSA